MDDVAIEHPFSLKDQVALVTGAGRGLGRAIAEGLSNAGASVALAARSIPELEGAAASIRARGGTTTTHQVDVRRAYAVQAMVRDVIAVHGRIDILVNNAGAKVVHDIVELSEADWDLVIDTNLKGAFFCAQAVGRHMLERGAGKIVNVASTYGVVAAPGRAAYAASKAGLIQLTRVMAAEWASRGINVNAIAPTSAATALNEALFADEDWRSAALSRIPAGRFLQPEDVVGSVVFLVSKAADMIHGHVLLIDGGFTVI